MDKEFILKNYQDLINLGFSETMLKQVTQDYPYFVDIIENIVKKCSTFNDNDTNMPQIESYMPSLYQGGINNSSSSKYPPSSMGCIFVRPFSEYNLSSVSEFF